MADRTTILSKFTSGHILDLRSEVIDMIVSGASSNKLTIQISCYRYVSVTFEVVEGFNHY